jgi:quinol monooxygenase YgiN
MSTPVRQLVTEGLLVILEANPGKEEEVAGFLESALPLVEQEPGTAAWFAVRSGPSTFGIFDVFPDESAREAHLSGKVAPALMQRAGELFSETPNIQKVDVLAAKLPVPEMG